MGCSEKRRITTNLLQVALLLLYLRGEIPVSYNQRNNGYGSPEYILGQSWGYAQTDFHRHGYDPISVHPKSVQSFEQNYYNYSDNDILDLLRSHTLNSFRSHISEITRVSKTMPAFQNVTAYLVSNASTSVSSNLPPIIPSMERPLLVSVNVDVPSSSRDEESGNPPAISETNEENLALTQDEIETEDNSFHLISGNIVFLPEPDSEDPLDAWDFADSFEAEVPNSTRIEDVVSSHSEAEEKLDEDPMLLGGAALGAAPSFEHQEEVPPEPGPSWSSSSPYAPLESPGRLWDEIQHDALDEEFSLSLALEDDLAMEDVLAAAAAPSQFFYDSGDDEDEMALTAVPPMALHDDLWDADCGIFDALLESEATDGEPNVDALLDDDEGSLPSPPLKSVEEEGSVDSGQASCASGADSGNEEGSSVTDGSDMIQTASIYANSRPAAQPPQPRSFQVHARMQGFLRGSSMDQRWQELANLLSLQPQHDPSGAALPHPYPHHFPPHHHHPHHPAHHLHHPSSSLHHHSMHHPPFSSAGPPTGPYADATRSVLLQNSSLPVPPAEINTTTSYPSVPMGPPPNLGSALASSMHLTNSSDPMIDPSSHYKMIEPSHHDMLYYPNMTSNGEMSNQTTEGFLSSILNEDDLQLMDMAMNEGMYTMRMMDNSSGAVANAGATGAPPGVGLNHGLSHQNNCTLGASSGLSGAAAIAVSEDRMEASSDSAVSSMGSERVPPITDPHMSDNEWNDPDVHPHGSHEYGSDYSSKLRGYDYYGGKGDGIHRVGAPVAQKKHQMFGKRVQQDHNVPNYGLGSHPSSGLCVPYPSSSGVHPSSSNSMDPLEMKYGCGVDFGRHDDGRPGEGPAEVHNNHSYSLPQSQLPNSVLSLRNPRPPSKDKPKKEYLSRDEKRARSMNLPLSTDEIINLPMDEFNERLSKYDLSESQLSLIRDIRRRGKNKVAAQNCRKRKLDQILQLAEEVQRIREKKHALMRDQESLLGRRNDLREKYSQLYRTVFQALRDREGNAYSPYEWSLQQAADGNIILVPRNSVQPSSSGTTDSLDSSIRRAKTKDEIKKDGQT